MPVIGLPLEGKREGNTAPDRERKVTFKNKPLAKLLVVAISPFPVSVGEVLSKRGREHEQLSRSSENGQRVEEHGPTKFARGSWTDKQLWACQNSNPECREESRGMAEGVIGTILLGGCEGEEFEFLGIDLWGTARAGFVLQRT